jgi:alpha-ketoglutarate-dependent taurine dioxygenase
MTRDYEPLTASGRGAKITDRPIVDFAVEEIRDLIARYRWLAFKENPVTSDDVLAYLGKFGRLVQNDRRQKGVLKLDGSKKEEVLLGEGFMPLHRDGALMGTTVALVGIHCGLYRNVTGGARTFVSDVESAVKHVPPEYLELVRERGIEGKPVDAYYVKPSDVWHPIPGFIDVAGTSYLNVGFPYRPGEKASWLVRIPGVEDDRCQAIFETMRATLMDEKYCYYHSWEEGDVLLLDNLRTLHGREAFQGERALANIQVVAE